MIKQHIYQSSLRFSYLKGWVIVYKGQMFYYFQNKSTSLSPGFCVLRLRQYDTICWELNLISGFLAFFWLIVWADGINKCGWCLAEGRGCWLKGPHQIPSVSWLFIIPYASTFIKLSHLYQEFCVLCIVIMIDGGGMG